jgi:hypothetical protein
VGHLVTLSEPTPFELELAASVAEVAEQSASADLAPLIAGALASHRTRLAGLAVAMLPASSCTVSDEVLEHMAEGWTPQQVRALIADHRALRSQLARARELMPAVLEDDRGEP